MSICKKLYNAQYRPVPFSGCGRVYRSATDSPAAYWFPDESGQDTKAIAGTPGASDQAGAAGHVFQPHRHHRCPQ